MIAISLQSGSSGNCWFIESDGVRILIDAGLSVRQVRRRLASFGRAEVPIDGLFLSHEHSDHVAGAASYVKHFGVPLHLTPKTMEALKHTRKGSIDQVAYFESGEVLSVGHLRVETIPTPHDSVDGSAFVVDDGRHRLGVFTDLGHVTEAMRAAVRSLDGIFLESNYDPRLLASGRYHPALKQRISGGAGHLSNVESAELLQCGQAEGRLRWACLCHLSGENNSPELVMTTHREFLGESLALTIDSRTAATGVFEL